jgi:hypothetical protein
MFLEGGKCYYRDCRLVRVCYLVRVCNLVYSLVCSLVRVYNRYLQL